MTYYYQNLSVDNNTQIMLISYMIYDETKCDLIKGTKDLGGGGPPRSNTSNENSIVTNNSSHTEAEGVKMKMMKI